MAAAAKVVLLAGGLGGARLAPELRRALGPDRLTVIANVGDDLDWFGLRVCPDLDSLSYALAGLWDRDRGWGRRDETFRVQDTLRALGADTWFRIGDADLALHLERTVRLRAGKTLTQATQELSRRLGIDDVEILPASEQPSPTRFRLEDGRVLDFQEWYVRERAGPEVRETVLSTGAPACASSAAVAAAGAVVLAPSNPVTSIGAILALEGMRAAVGAVARRIAVSPVVVGRRTESASIAHHTLARRRVLAAQGLEDRPGAIARQFADLVQTFVLDRADSGEEEEVRRTGLEPVLAHILDDRQLAETLAALVERS